MYVSPIKQYKYSFTLMLFDVFVVSPKQIAFIIHYMYLVGFYKYFNISTFLKNLLKIISIVIIVSVLDIPYLLYRLGYIIINNIWVYGIINLEYNTYRVIRERFTYGVGFNELSIRAFDGFIKLNMFSVTKSNAEKLSSVLSKPVKNQVNERLISLGSRDYIHRDIPLIPGNKEGIALCLSHNSPVEPILDSSEVLGLKQTGFLLNPQNLNFIRTVDTKLINCKYGALRIITLYKLINNEGFLIENNIAAGFHNRVTWTEPDHNLKIRELMLSENYKTIAELKLNNTLNAETIKMALNSSSNPLERKVWDYVYNHTSKDTILEMRNLPQLNYIQKIKLFQQLYPNLFHYNSISNIL